MNVRIKKLVENAVIPKYAKDGDAGLDLTATSVTDHEQFIEYGTGLAIEIPRGFVGLLFPRSSVTNKDLVLKNSVGVIDSNYRGEIKVRFMDFVRNDGEESNVYNAGERVAQLVILALPTIELVEAEELDSTDRAAGGFGSTGK